MNVLSRFKRVAFLSLSLMLLSSSSVFASNLLITRHFSGIWDMPDHESQGLILQIGEQEGEGGEPVKVGIAYWFTYGEDLQTTWFLGVGPVTGNVIEMELYTAYNIEFMAADKAGDGNVESVGKLILTFGNCNQGQAAFDTPEDVIGTGEFRIKRLNSIYHSRCSGGISDDTPSDRKPMKLEVDLDPARDDVTGEGEAEFWESVNRSEFEVKVEGAPNGLYMLEVCSEKRGEMQVTEGEGKLEFKSPQDDDDLLLNFDPRNCKIELLDGDGVAFTSGDDVLSEKQKGKDKDKNKTVIKVDMESTGEFGGAEGELEYEISDDEREFEVEVEDVPVGLYAVWVGDDNVGDVDVVMNDGKTKGKLKFTDPEKAGTLLLDFDPLGKMIEIRQGDTVFLKALFPTE